MRFRDEVRVHVAAGDGGDGSVHWRREKYVPRGGPDGGDGGNGGAIIFLASPEQNTLSDLAYNPHIRAEAGEAGSGARCDGKSGVDTVVAVPVGTQVLFRGQVVADLSVPGARWVAARGGRGGKGNTFFKSSTNPAPTHAQPGRAGEKFEFDLVLKSVADVGFVGLPNVGKSTLISAISNARPLIADYPFTTLTPHLGVVELAGQRRFVIADIPGLIPDAHLGKGLGLTFLRHIERTTVLAHLIDVRTGLDGTRRNFVDDTEPTAEELQASVMEQLLAIEHELRSFSEELIQLPRIVVFTKSDVPGAAEAAAITAPYFAERGLPTVVISSATGAGLEELKEHLYRLVRTSTGA